MTTITTIVSVWQHKYCACTATLTNTLRVLQHTDTNNIKFFLLPTLMTSNKNFIEIHSVVLRPTDRISSKCVVHCVQFMDRTQNVPRTEDTPRLQFVDRTQNVRRTEDTPQLQFRVVVLPYPIHPLTRINSQQLTGCTTSHKPVLHHRWASNTSGAKRPRLGQQYPREPVRTVTKLT